MAIPFLSDAKFSRLHKLKFHSTGEITTTGASGTNFDISAIGSNTDLRFLADNDDGSSSVYFLLDASMADYTTPDYYTRFPDNSHLVFGNSANTSSLDFEIYHSGTTAYLQGDSSIYIASENLIQLNADNGVELRHNNSRKIHTTTTGVDVTGTINLDNLTINGAQGSDGQVLTSTGSGIAWEDASGGASLSGGEASKVAVWSATDTLTHNDNFHFDTTNVRLGIGDSNPNRTLVVSETRTGSTASDAYTAIVKSVQSSGASPNPGTGGLKVQYTSSSSNVHAFGLVAGSSSSDFLTTGPMHFYTNSDLDTVSATGFAMQLDTSQRLILGSMTASQKLNVSGNVTADRYYGNSSTVYYIDPNDGTQSANLASKIRVGTGSLNLSSAPTWGVAHQNIFASTDTTNGGTVTLMNVNSSYAAGHASGTLQFVIGGGNTSMTNGGYGVAAITAISNVAPGSGTSGGGNLIFKTSGGYSSVLEKMRLTHEGKLGIGTNDPTARLHVSGTNASAAIDWSNTTATTGRNFRWVALNTGGFAVEDLTAGGANRLSIGSTGNVGVNTASATSKFHVTGDIQTTTGSVKIEDNWGQGFYSAEQLSIVGSYPSLALRNNSTDNKWLIHHDGNDLTFYAGADFDSTSWSKKVQVDSGNQGMGAKIFYDLDNSGYYLDPASSSVALNINGKIAQAKEDYNIDSSHPNAIFQANRGTQTDRGTWPGTYYYGVNFGDRTKGIQLASAYSSAKNLYFRSGTDNSGSENGANAWKNWRQLFHDDYHPNADKWTTARTVTFAGGDVSGNFSIDGSANVSNVNLTVANDSHTHDGRYYTESESDSRFTSKDHFRHTGTGYYTSTTTADLLTEALGDDAFDSGLSAHKTGWSYAGNGNLTDAGRLTELAGTSWLWWTDNFGDNVQGNVTGLCIAPTTGGSAGKMFVYNNQGSTYSPGWREIWTSTSDGSGSGLDADLLDGAQGSSYLRSDASDTFNAGNAGLFEVQGTFKVSNPSATSQAVTISNASSGGDTYISNGNGNTIFFGVPTLNTTNIEVQGSALAALFRGRFNSNFYTNHESTSDSIRVAGDIVAFYSSDRRYKENIKPIESPIEKVKAISGVTFEWNEKSHKETGKKDIGVIAQEVEEVLPEIVETRSNGYKAVDYQKLTAVLIEAVKDQQKQIDELKSIINGSS